MCIAELRKAVNILIFLGDWFLTARELSYKYKMVKGKNDIQWLFSPVCPLKGHEQ